MADIRIGASIASGLAASLVGGVVMAALMLVARQPVDASLIGICALWGVVFAFAATLLRAEASVGGALLIGVVIGLASDIFDVRTTTAPAWRWLGHVAFGLSVALAPLLFRGLWARRSGVVR